MLRWSEVGDRVVEDSLSMGVGQQFPDVVFDDLVRLHDDAGKRILHEGPTVILGRHVPPTVTRPFAGMLPTYIAASAAGMSVIVFRRTRTRVL